MSRRPRVDYPRAVLGALLLATLLGLVVAASTSTVAFGLYNAAWDGASDLRTIAEAAGADPLIVQNTSAYRTVEPNGTVAVILAPDRRYDTDEATGVRRFVEAGGTLLVAEDYGPHANRLLAAVGARARVDGRPLRDERSYYRSPALPVADDVANHTLAAGVNRITLNHGTAVQPNGATVLVATSGYAYLDGNRNGALDDDETLGRYPVTTVEAVGDGRVVVLGDPSALINVMLDRPGNRAFAARLFDRHDRVLLDYSHTSRIPPLAAAMLVVRRSVAVQLGLGLLAVAVLVVAERRPGWIERARARTGRVEPAARSLVDPEDVIRSLQRRHPDWDRDRVRRVVTDVITIDNRRNDIITDRDERGDNG